MLEDKNLLTETMERFRPELVIHLAAQAGVRYSIENPDAYISANVLGTFNVLEALRDNVPKHLMIASTSAVYDGNTGFPFEETSLTTFPISLFAATKKAGEVISSSYANLCGIPTTCFLFLTAYGSWGRPDKALFKFVDRTPHEDETEVYDNGQMSGDFVCIDDLVECISRLSEVVPNATGVASEKFEFDTLSPVAPWRVVNIAGGQPVQRTRFIDAIEDTLWIKAKKKMLPMQSGDVTDTLASPALFVSWTDFILNNTIETNVKSLIDWNLECTIETN